jgi:hypothetical protein
MGVPEDVFREEHMPGPSRTMIRLHAIPPPSRQPGRWQGIARCLGVLAGRPPPHQTASIPYRFNTSEPSSADRWLAGVKIEPGHGHLQGDIEAE